ncbi:hypothetical protein [Pseudomonas aeruginosa]|uniref:hypothetical protein n=1 Tax=Pseudomonas aeruginosa TaxID=287 RepID=UPI0013CE2E01|nr:hypothetical protein [Pseudomonas aeruginosa]MBI7545467.1 hypothetical protein [Pseudomonas aeruginosa]MBI7712440.1 hypothetical protein [Pseudomonas aeruginosa]MBI9204515.1 hypothetical protein [Pseudomonas aeruginosa]MDJ1327690.1 hypothetical protein [Pseudomonas aeruginosa]MDP5916469.1 hypothetical protein [Pseudomonas aeruginosa]
MGERWCSLMELAPQFGYRYLAIESANANALLYQKPSRQTRSTPTWAALVILRAG